MSADSCGRAGRRLASGSGFYEGTLQTIVSNLERATKEAIQLQALAVDSSMPEEGLTMRVYRLVSSILNAARAMEQLTAEEEG